MSRPLISVLPIDTSFQLVSSFAWFLSASLRRSMCCSLCLYKLIKSTAEGDPSLTPLLSPSLLRAQDDPRSADGRSLRAFVRHGWCLLYASLCIVYLAKGASTSVESPVVITYLCVFWQDSVEDFPVELPGVFSRRCPASLSIGLRGPYTVGLMFALSWKKFVGS